MRLLNQTLQINQKFRIKHFLSKVMSLSSITITHALTFHIIQKLRQTLELINTFLSIFWLQLLAKIKNSKKWLWLLINHKNVLESSRSLSGYVTIIKFHLWPRNFSWWCKKQFRQMMDKYYLNLFLMQTVKDLKIKLIWNGMK